MNNIKKIIALTLTVILALTLMAACGGDKVKDDVPVSDVSSAIASAIGADGNLAARDANYISNMIGLESSDYTECVVMVNTIGTSIDEFGVFKAGDGDQAKEIAAVLQEYIDTAKNDSLRFSYTPEELPKVESAKIETIGNYVMYSILSDDARASAVTAFENSLKEG